jgi:hypothetical protein
MAHEMEFLRGGSYYELYVEDQDLPHLDSPWTKIEVNDDVYQFQSNKDRTKVFTISGYIQQSTISATRTHAEALNTALNSTPSGTFTDGFGTSYTVIVEDWTIKPVAGVNKWTFTMSCRMLR